MSTPEPRALTELQLAILRVLWSRGEETVAGVHDALAARDLAPQTVGTILKRLERRGIVTHRTDGRTHVFRALVSESDATRDQLDEVATRLFDGDVGELLTTLIEHRELEPGDLARIRALIEAKERAEERNPKRRDRR